MLRRILAALCLLAPVALSAQLTQHHIQHIDQRNTDPTGAACTVANELVQFAGDLYVCDPTTHVFRATTGSSNSGGSGNANAVALQGYAVSQVSPQNTQTLLWNATNGQYEPTSLNFGTAGTCSSGQFFRGTSPSSTPTCAAIAYSNLTGSVPTWNQNTTGTASNLSGSPAIAVSSITNSGSQTQNGAATFNAALTATDATGINASAGPVNTATGYKIAGNDALLPSTTLPATCTLGSIWTNPAGTAKYCSATNVWSDFVTTSAAMSGTPTFVNDAGAGTSPTTTIISGSIDGDGLVSITPGTSPSASAGVVTIVFSSSYSSVRACSIFPAGVNSAALSGTAALYVDNSDTTTAHFVIKVGSTALTAATAYKLRWWCTR